MTAFSATTAFPAPPGESRRLRELVAPLVVRGTASRGFDSAVQYRGVYPHERGWRGKVKFFDRQIHIPTQPTAQAVAVLLARWWECRLGPHWGFLLYKHGWRRGGPGRDGGRVWRDAPWRILRDRSRPRRTRVVLAPPGGERSNVDRKFYRYGQEMEVRTEPCRVVAWVRGGRVEVPGRWDWRRDAAHGLFEWLEAEYGADAGPILWFPGDRAG